jgi:6-phosphogluconate dehydrogenase (decarboxylating)
LTGNKHRPEGKSSDRGEPEDSFADKLLSALRFQFGGHEEETDQKEGA